jgi:hypothetical protein
MAKVLARRFSYLLCFLLLAIISFSSCKKQDKVRDSKREKFAALSGKIDESQANLVISQIRAGKTSILIQSEGGDIAAAIRIGAEISKYKVRVYIKKMCLSACAHFIFNPASKKIVLRGAIIGYHGTATARYDYFKRAGDDALANEYFKLSQRELQFYKQEHISTSLLIEPFYQVEPICYYIVNKKNVPIRSFIKTKFTFFTPTLNRLNELGVKNIYGFWPTNQFDLNYLQSILANSVNATFKIEINGSGGSIKNAKANSCKSLTHNYGI